MSRPSRGLGRGLASLIPDSALDPAANEEARTTYRTVPIDEIRPNPEQPREVFASEDLNQLSDSIRAHGVMSPLVVRKWEGRYVLIAGERRLRAAALAGLSEVPVILRSAENPGVQLELALVENLQRSDLDPIEAARGFQRLIEVYGYTQDGVAQRVGKNRSTVANAVRLLALPEFVLDAVREDVISAGHARALLPLGQGARLREALDKVVAQSLSVRATERLVKRILAGETGTKGAPRTLQYANKLLSEALHTAVTIRPRKRGGGRIIVDYSSAEDLERLIGQIRKSKKES